MSRKSVIYSMMKWKYDESIIVAPAINVMTWRNDQSRPLKWWPYSDILKMINETSEANINNGNNININV